MPVQLEGQQAIHPVVLKGVNPGSHRLRVGIFDYAFRGVVVVALVNASSFGETSVSASLLLKGESGGADYPSVFG